MKKMDARIIRDMCDDPYICVKCKKRLCALVDRGNDYECIVDKHYSTPDGIVCEACYAAYAAEKERTTPEPYQKKILLAVDGSDGSMDAVRHVAKFVAREKADVVLFHVGEKADQGRKDLPTHPLLREQIGSVVALDAARKHRMEEFMNRARQILLDAGFPEEAVRVEVREKRASVVRDIVEESKEGYTTIVVGRKGLSKLKDAVLGNVTARLLEKMTDVPVWVA